LAESAGKEDPGLNGVNSIKKLVELSQLLWVVAGKITWNGGAYKPCAHGNPVVSSYYGATVTRGKVSVAGSDRLLKVRANPTRKGAIVISAHSANRLEPFDFAE
jgi:hypothetical protein